ncbi:MAG: hypothetical protein QNK04_10735 [Myxococcota bacterium]|nr:hypothetical protein [Myxococcota bacterium]
MWSTPPALATWLLAGWFLAAGALLACASEPVAFPPLDLPFADTPPPDVEASVTSRIDRSIPEVTYHTPAPRPSDTSAASVLDPMGSLGPDEMKLLIRQLESLDGKEKIVCLPTRDRAFGECAFPAAD